MFPGVTFFRKSFNRKKVIGNGIFPPFSNWNNFILKSSYLTLKSHSLTYNNALESKQKDLEFSIFYLQN